MNQRSATSGASSGTPACSRSCRTRSRRLARYSGSKNPAAECLHGDPAALGAEIRDPLEQQILTVGGQVRQQPLGRPCGWLTRIEPRRLQRIWPVMPEVDGNRHVTGGRLRTVCAQRVGLEREHLRLVDLVHHAAVVPRQPPCPGVEPCGEDHRLLDATRTRRDEEFVEPFGAGCGVSRDRADPLGQVPLRQLPAARDGLIDEHLCIRVGVQRALGRRFLRRAHAIPNAVAPTLSVMSQESLSVLAIRAALRVIV